MSLKSLNQQHVITGSFLILGSCVATKKSTYCVDGNIFWPFVLFKKKALSLSSNDCKAIKFPKGKSEEFW